MRQKNQKTKKSSQLSKLTNRFSPKLTILLSLLTVLLFALINPYPDTKEILRVYYPFSALRIQNEYLPAFINFGISSGYFLFFVPTIFIFILSRFFSPSNTLLFSGLFLSLGSIINYSRLINTLSKGIDINKNYQLISKLIFLLLPWTLFTFIYNLEALFTLFIFISFLYAYFSKKESYLHLLLFLLSFTSWPGLIFSILFVVVNVFNTKKPKYKKYIIALIILAAINNKYIVSSINNSYLSELTPKVVTQEITEKAKIDYLSTNKELLIPSPVRKLIYNKPVFIIQKIINKFVSYFDIDQWSSVLDSYALTKKSGIPPKGTWPLLAFWMIPPLALGLYVFLKNRSRISSPFVTSFVSSLIAYFLFSKNEITTNQILLLPYLPIFITIGIALIVSFNKSRLYKIIIIIVALLSLVYSFRLGYRFIYAQDMYRYTHGFLYYKISNAVKENIDNSDKVFITERFGSTLLGTAYYGVLSSNQYWSNYFNNTFSSGKITFKSFLLGETIEKNSLYIGLKGEFEKGSPSESVKQSIKVLDDIKAWDTPTTEFSDHLLVVKSK